MDNNPIMQSLADKGVLKKWTKDDGTLVYDVCVDKDKLPLIGKISVVVEAKKRRTTVGQLKSIFSKLERVMANAPLLQQPRKAKNETDFGDQETVGLHVKAINKSFDEFKDYDFGIYLGNCKGQYHVGTCKISELTPSKLVSYDTLEALHKYWILD